ncbi:hypothetical protein [Tunicatimonas pelagia]|uniref:hypothetical protein n=1 Tax=Tunicatimonas pelagia TaxID=931531 RepID=UPI002664FE6F|nr:hypothetical protein [Tunicatimonas pelagia]WKN44984.1 hypothetical protein P0M28_08410 [Tunicatimonas pelagia]
MKTLVPIILLPIGWQNDPAENVNVILQPEMEAVVAEHRALLGQHPVTKTDSDQSH